MIEFSPSELQRLSRAMESKNFSTSQVIDFIWNKKTVETGAKFKLVVDYTKTIEETMIDINYANSDIDLKKFTFPEEMIGKKEKIRAKLFHFDCPMRSVDVVIKMKNIGFRPATFMELLALGAAYPDLQKKFPIIALDFVWRIVDWYAVPFLDDGTKINVRWADNEWRSRCRFLGAFDKDPVPY